MMTINASVQLFFPAGEIRSKLAYKKAKIETSSYIMFYN